MEVSDHAECCALLQLPLIFNPMCTRNNKKNKEREKRMSPLASVPKKRVPARLRKNRSRIAASDPAVLVVSCKGKNK